MPNMKDAMRKAGLQGGRNLPRPKGPPSGAGGGDRGPFPPGYPKYFDAEGRTRPKLLLDEAEAVAKRFDEDRLKRHQLRAFFDHAKSQMQRLRYGASFDEIHADVAKLKAFASDRAGRSDNRLPESFKTFIDRNIEAIQDEKSFLKGFMPHFEAVVAYCSRIRE